MKKYLIGSIFGFTLALSSMSVFAKAQQYILTKSNSVINVEGVAYESNQNPILLYDGTTYVPLRAFTDMIGLDIGYNEETKAIDISSPKDITTNNSDNSNNTSSSSVDENGLSVIVENGKTYVNIKEVYFFYNVADSKYEYSYDFTNKSYSIIIDETNEVIFNNIPYASKDGLAYFEYDYYKQNLIPLLKEE